MSRDRGLSGAVWTQRLDLTSRRRVHPCLPEESAQESVHVDRRRGRPELRYLAEVERERLDVDCLAVRQLLRGEAQPLLGFGEMKIHVHRGYGRRWTKAGGEGSLFVVPDLLGQDRLAVLEDDDQALGTELLELLG